MDANNNLSEEELILGSLFTRIRESLRNKLRNISPYKYCDDEELERWVNIHEPGIGLKIINHIQRQLSIIENYQPHITDEELEEIFKLTIPELMAVNKTELIPIPGRSLKKLVKESCEKLVATGIIKELLVETKSNKCISPLIIHELSKKYYLTKEQKESIHTYLRKYEIVLKKDKSGKIIVG